MIPIAILCVLAWLRVISADRFILPINNLILSREAQLKANASKIVGGASAAPKQFPWAVGIISRNFQGDYFFCGGSIISRRSILTAAHCCRGMTSFSVRYGNNNLHRGSVANGTSCTSHPLYFNFFLWYDIAIVQLPEPILLSENAIPIQISKSAESISNNRQVTVSGWGRTSNSMAVSPILKYANLTTVPFGACIRNYGFAGIFLVERLFDVCAGAPNDGNACTGDSGSALVSYINRVPIQVGIVSFGVNAECRPNLPVVYTRTGPLQAWIAANTFN